MYPKYLSIAFSLFLATPSSAQTGSIIRFTSAHAMFPDTARVNGHDYNGKHFGVSDSYSDSSILIYVPPQFSSAQKISYVFWFHGWGNNIDSACKQYKLTEQFAASGRNAVFIFPEGPKNASDSYGGKLEQADVFQGLMKDVITQLTAHKIIKPVNRFNINDYDISLAGHSGAYRVISRILNKTPVNEVILFDAMYGGNDAYLEWLAVPAHRFINIYTKDGGTFDNSHLIMKQLADSLQIPFVSMNEDAVNPEGLLQNQKLFIYSSMQHNEVIAGNNNWERFLRYRPLKKN